MSDWRSRALIGAAMVVIAPLSARLASTAATEKKANAAPTAQAVAAAPSIGPVDLTNPIKARAVSAEETRLEFRRTLCGFLKLYADSHDTVNPSPSILAASSPNCSDPSEGAVEAVIAIAPDPIRTHLALRFDRAIDDLGATAQNLGWRFDKAWLPWPSQQIPPATRFQDKYIDDAMQDTREQQPGLLLFRNADERTAGNTAAMKPLVVLVVGDSPTGGVNRAQFRLAVQAWRSLHTAPPESCPDTDIKCKIIPQRLLILGPSFSGSVASLNHLIGEEFAQPVSTNQQSATQKNCPAPISITVASGTITSGAELGGLWDLDGDCRSQVEVAPVTFSADVLYARNHLLRFLYDRLPQTNDPVAELNEEESQFGAQTVQTEWTELESLVGLPMPADPAERTKRKLAIEAQQRLLSLVGRRRPPLQFTFPRGISLLRNAYERNGILGFGHGSSSDTPKTQLDLNLQEDTGSGDAVQEFAGEQGASSIESRMAQIAATLEKDKVSVAVLTATDILDTIFVARYLRAHAPSVTVVILDADLLLLRGGSDVSLDGVYVVTPYPLIPRNGIWSADTHGADSELSLRSFAKQNTPLNSMPILSVSQGDEGISNAAKYLLCGGGWGSSVSNAGEGLCGWKTRKGFNGEYLWFPEYEPPISIPANWSDDFKLKPPLWLSVIGHGGFQPISLIDIDQHDSALPSSSEESQRDSALSLPQLGVLDGHEPVGQTHPAEIRDESMAQVYVTFAVLLLVIAVHAWACTRCRLDRSFAWSYAAADEKPWKARLIVQAGLNLLGIYLLSLLWVHDMAGLHLEPLWFHAVLLGTQLALVVLTGVVAWRSAAGGGLGRRHLRIVVSAVLVSAAFVLLVDIWLWSFLAPNSDLIAERAFFFYRGAYLLNGACPTLPVMLLVIALTVWLRGRLAKLVFYGYRVPRLPAGRSDLRCPGNHSVRHLNRLLAHPLWYWRKTSIADEEDEPQTRLSINVAKGQIALLSTALVGAVCLVTAKLGAHSLAFSHFDGWVDILSLIVAVGTVHNLLVSLAAWHMLKGQCLTQLKQSPIRWGFNWVRGFSWKRLWTSPEGFTAEAELEYVMRNVEADQRGYPPLGRPSTVKWAYERLRSKYRSHDKDTEASHFFERPASSVRWAEELAQRSRTLYRSLASEADQRLERLTEEWSEDFGPLTGTDTARGNHLELEHKDLGDETKKKAALQRQADEEFVALVYLTYIRSVMVQIRNRIGTAAGLYILLLWALTGYPWMDRHGILLQMSALLVLLTVVAVIIYSEMQRDEILSRTTETAAGKIDSAFYMKILSVVGIPALSLVASQFPEFSNAIFSWLMPGLTTVR